jgi:cyclopropane-fatty-acyl-phospholipid synthase
MKISWLLFIILMSTVVGSIVFYKKFLLSQIDPERIIKKILINSDITINGTRPQDITLYNNAVFSRVLSEGSLGLGESYMDEWWDCSHLDEFFFHLLRSDALQKVPYTLSNIGAFIKAHLINLQSKSRAYEVGKQHYDLGNDFFAKMLDSCMVYSCGYWKNAQTLEEAQQAKLELICKKLELRPGMRVLDIGCGWGGFARYAAQNYGVSVVGITISQEQAHFAQHYCKECSVEIRIQDYRDLKETFDRIVSVGMFEHVGYKNYKTFMQIAHNLLTDDGLFLLHTIGNNITKNWGDVWITKYIFPNGLLPSLCQIGQAIEGLFVMEDWHNFSADYDKTLMAWYKNFETEWPSLENKYDQRFYRMWKYYLLSCAGLFRSRGAQLWQIMLSKKGVIGGYNSIR